MYARRDPKFFLFFCFPVTDHKSQPQQRFLLTDKVVFSYINLHKSRHMFALTLVGRYLSVFNKRQTGKHIGSQKFNSNILILFKMSVSTTTLAKSHPAFEVVSAPQPFINRNKKSVFLAGSIDIGKEVNWQTSIVEALSHLPVVVLDPFRPDWDSTWKEDITFEPFRTQVAWELEQREIADVVSIYFGPEAKATITLLELGLSAHTEKAIVCCPAGYWKRGNVQAVCQKFGIKLVDSVEELAQGILEKLKGMVVA